MTQANLRFFEGRWQRISERAAIAIMQAKPPEYWDLVLAKMPRLRDEPQEEKIEEPKESGTRSAIRNRRVTRATPKWADRAAIRKVYEKARRRALHTCIPHHVDHIIPIYGTYVSGLHVHNNLRVIPAVDNVRRPRIWIPK
jgi:hypothetical protein